MSDEQQCIDLLQRLHELTQQNCAESAGTAWFELINTIVRNGSVYHYLTLADLEEALRDNDINPRAL